MPAAPAASVWREAGAPAGAGSGREGEGRREASPGTLSHRRSGGQRVGRPSPGFPRRSRRARRRLGARPRPLVSAGPPGARDHPAAAFGSAPYKA